MRGRQSVQDDICCQSGGAISTYTVYDRIEAIHSPGACRFGHRPSRGPDRGPVLCRRECLPRTTAGSDGGRGGDAGRNAPVRRHAVEPAFVRFRDAVTGQRQRPGHPSATAAAPPTAQQSQQRPTPQREAKEAPAPRPPTLEATQAELVRAEKTEPEKQNQSFERQPAASPPEQTPEQPNIAEAVTQYAALGGPLGGGFAAPPVDTNVPGYDWTVPFRERVGVCSKVPKGVEPDVSIKIRISFNRNGTLVSRRACSCRPNSKTACADGKCSRCSGKVPAVHHAAAGKIQAVEDDGGLRHPAVRALVRQIHVGNRTVLQALKSKCHATPIRSHYNCMWSAIDWRMPSVADALFSPLRLLVPEGADRALGE